MQAFGRRGGTKAYRDLPIAIGHRSQGIGYERGYDRQFEPTAFEQFLRDSPKIRQRGRGLTGHHILSREPVDGLDPVRARSGSGRESIDVHDPIDS